MNPIAKPAGGPAFESRPRTSAATSATQCPRCGQDSPGLCRKCENEIKKLIRSAISASGAAALPCPKCKGHGYILTVVPTRDGHRYGKLLTRKEMRRCPTCLGLGHLRPTLPISEEIKVVPSDVGLVRARTAWRPMNRIGHIQGLPRFAGTAYATDGVLVAIRLLDGTTTIGHLDSFVEAVEPKTKVARKSKLALLMEEFA